MQSRVKEGLKPNGNRKGAKVNRKAIESYFTIIKADHPETHCYLGEMKKEKKMK